MGAVFILKNGWKDVHVIFRVQIILNLREAKYIIKKLNFIPSRKKKNKRDFTLKSRKYILGLF